MDISPALPVEEIELRLEEQAQVDQERGEEILAKATQELQKHGHSPEGVMLEGDAASQLIDYAGENEIDLIVAGSRGLSRVQSWLLGSVSRKLVHYAGCSVMIVKTPPEG
jgi:nucleotide-binding universal stress UspA family protein